MVVSTPSRLAASELTGRIDFSRDIRPIFSNFCYKCHGPDEDERQASLRLDVKEAALALLESGATAIVPGDSAHSALYQRIVADSAERMPPADTGKTLTREQIQKIRDWIDQGADWRAHWSFIKPERPPLPEVKHAAWPRGAIDYFILSRLERERLAPEPEAARTTLARRVTLDLTGLPPTPAEVDAFLADSSSDAYEKLVDRLLASPHYGEHMARYWLDAARYGDTHGLHLDNERTIWPYRDWVIAAFNANMPFDQFTVEQLAGDLLPNPTVSQQVATGFNRCNVTTSEGGSIDEEFLVRYAVDRVDTTSTVWMGLTTGCAVCHDHKYDPVTQREFYQLFAFFNSLTEKAMDGNRLDPPPVVKVPSAEQARKLAAVRDAIQATEAELAALMPGIDAAQAAWEAEELRRLEGVWQIVEPAELSSSGGSSFRKLSDASVLIEGTNPNKDVYEIVLQTDASAITAVRLEALTHDSLPQKGPGRALNGNLVLSELEADVASVADAGQIQSVKFAAARADHSQTKGDFLVRKAIDGTVDGDNGWAVAGFERHEPRTAVFRLASPVGFEGGTRLRLRLRHESKYAQHGIGRFRLAVSRDPAQLAPQTATAEDDQDDATLSIGTILSLPPAERTEELNNKVRDHFRRHHSPEWAKRADALQSLKDEEKAADAQIPTTLVMQEMPQRREAFVLIRGQYNKHGEPVQPGVPAVLPPLQADAPANRLALAKWIVDPAHPLTARVTVNRFWQQYFGMGLVKTAEDFGSQGEPPSHPELLDWLATEFIASGWDVKALQKLIVTSATYRQSSRVSADKLQRDPDNRLLARAPRFRLDGEAVRDLALSVSTLLSPQIGGPSAKPYQPPGLWEAIGYTTSNTAKFVQDHGPALYRRGMYTFWKRTSPPPSMLTFDAPSREACTVSRARTNTPLQALVLMNDTQFVEAARKLAERVMTETGPSVDEQANYLFRLATARPPDDDERRVLVATYEAHRAEFQRDGEAATRLLSVGEAPRNEQLNVAELAAWTMVANLVLNLDETLTKG